MPDFKARPTTYKGIKMRSRLEAGFAQWLDTNTLFKWEYEPQAFGGDGGQYLPDFLLHDVAFDGVTMPAYVEVKPPPFFVEDDGDDEDESNYLRHEALWAQMATIWESVVPCLLLIAGPGRLQHVWDDPHVKTPWAVECEWTTTAHGIIGVAITASRERWPWHGDWWKVQPR